MAYITCFRCKRGGGTLKKIGRLWGEDKYRHIPSCPVPARRSLLEIVRSLLRRGLGIPEGADAIRA